jgi:methylenetetrahydrofolate reductase (NADPH)
MTMDLQNKLAARRFVLTAEVTPPVSLSRADLLDKALPLKGLADAVNVTDGAGARAHLGAVTAAAMLLEAGIEPILQLTCRDRNRIGLQSELMSAAAWGIVNILALRGDDPAAGDQPDAKPVFDLDARQLIETARRLRDDGELPTGQKVGGRAAFFLGAADGPVDPKPGWTPKALEAKIAAGAQFAQTQFCMDADVVHRYTQRLAEYGIDKKLALLVGVAPLGEVGAVDEGQAVRHHHSRCVHRTARTRPRSGRGRRQDMRRPDRAAVRYSRRCRRAHHGAN